MAHIFISYKSETERQALDVVRRLENAGIDCWIACRDIPVGSDYIDEIPTAIDECPFFILLLSRQMHISPWVKLELKQAISSGKQVLPLMLEDFKLHPSYTFMLQNYQIYPLFIDNGDTFRDVVSRILKVVPQRKHKPSVPKKSPPPSVPAQAFTPYLGKDPYVFVSCSHKDCSRVMPIVQLLTENGFRVWMDTGVDAGDLWPQSIAERLSDCACFLPMLSNNYLNSKACGDELHFSLELGKPMLAIHLEELHMPPAIQLLLGRQQAVFYYKYPSNDAFIDRLTQTAVLAPCWA